MFFCLLIKIINKNSLYKRIDLFDEYCRQFLQKWSSICSSLLSTDVKDVVATNECITIFIFQLSIAVLFCLFQGDIHVSIQTSEHTYISRKQII